MQEIAQKEINQVTNNVQVKIEQEFMKRLWIVSLNIFIESLILAQDERWRRA